MYICNIYIIYIYIYIYRVVFFISYPTTCSIFSAFFCITFCSFRFSCLFCKQFVPVTGSICIFENVV